MLLYVDKKKEKQHKIKIFCLIVTCIFIVFTNVFSFHKRLNTSKENLCTYQSIKQTNDWFEKTDTLILFSKKNTKAPKIIFVPKKITKENALALAFIFSKLRHLSSKITFTKNLQDKDIIKDIAALFFKKEEPSAQHIIITSELKDFISLINQEHLLPHTFNFQNTKETSASSDLMNIINKWYPPQITPQSKSEQEQLNLQNFLNDHRHEITELINHNISPKFADKYLFLKNTRLCLKTNKQFYCKTEQNISFEQHLKETTQQFAKDEKPQKLVLLTSDEEIKSSSINLTKNTGIHFHYLTYDAFLLYQELKDITKNKPIIYIIKEKAGINPEYSTKNMHFYQFKTAEVNLDDNI